MSASAREWRAWQDAAAHYELPLNEFVRKCANQGVRLAFGRAPELRGGHVVWEKPIEPSDEAQ